MDNNLDENVKLINYFSVMQSDKLVGSIISLITNAGVRYEGTLVKVDGTERSMNLKDV